MKEILCADGAAEGPVILGSPFIFAHHKNFHRLLGGELVLSVLEEVVVPGNYEIVDLQVRRGPEVNIADLPAGARVPSDHDKQALAFPSLLGCGMRFQADVVAQGASQENVVPGSDGERWNVDIGEMLLDGQLLPVVVVVRMGKPVQKIRRKHRGGVSLSWIWHKKRVRR